MEIFSVFQGPSDVIANCSTGCGRKNILAVFRCSLSLYTSFSPHLRTLARDLSTHTKPLPASHFLAVAIPSTSPPPGWVFWAATGPVEEGLPAHPPTSRHIDRFCVERVLPHIYRGNHFNAALSQKSCKPLPCLKKKIFIFFKNVFFDPLGRTALCGYVCRK